ncbi:asparagine synthase [Allostreptomyces psammosilenae]|uniref:Asparagine synthase n=1 Tax=Allostreptomyces psammosilenae TaxID=1892865 RepID=A0A852ZV39_9ACTN|nr:asparagine synthase [Allostreptomyces psammosilenae]NYI05140.1 hypothetical protein [Allostreptomyces psammosilenae]
MRWIVGWSGTRSPHHPGEPPGPEPVGGLPLWTGPEPLWAVGDWRPEELRRVEMLPDGRTVTRTGPATATHDGADHTGPAGGPRTGPTPPARLAVVGHCHATDEQLAVALAAARAGALRHLTRWPGSYWTVLSIGTRTCLIGDLAGLRPVFHTPWRGGTAYATAALPLADLVDADLDPGYLAAALACPEIPEVLDGRTPYRGVRRLDAGHALEIRAGTARQARYERPPAAVGAAPWLPVEEAIERLAEALRDAVAARLTPHPAPTGPHPAPGHGPDSTHAPEGAAHAPGGSAAARPGTPTVPLGADLSGGTASATLALLAAAPTTAPAGGAAPHPHACSNRPGTPDGPAPVEPPAPDGEAPLAITWTPAHPEPAPAATPTPAQRAVRRARAVAAEAGMRHRVITGPASALPFAAFTDPSADHDPLAGPLPDHPGPALVDGDATRLRLAAGGRDHLVGHGARHVLDRHPARLADLALDRGLRHAARGVGALTRPGAEWSGATATGVLLAARRLAATTWADGMAATAARMLHRTSPRGRRRGGGTGFAMQDVYSAISWSAPGPAAAWLTGDALATAAAQLRAAAERPAPDTRPGERRARLALARYAADHRVLQQLAEAPGQRLHAPFLDDEVVRACRALPIEPRLHPGARRALLERVIRHAGGRGLPGVLAGHAAGGEPGQAGNAGTPPAAAARTGLRAAAAGLAELLGSGLLPAAGVVDRAAALSTLRAVTQGAEVPHDALRGLIEVVGTEVWLRRLQLRRGSCWTERPRTHRAPSVGLPRG